MVINDEARSESRDFDWRKCVGNVLIINLIPQPKPVPSLSNYHVDAKFSTYIELSVQHFHPSSTTIHSRSVQVLGTPCMLVGRFFAPTHSVKSTTTWFIFWRLFACIHIGQRNASLYVLYYDFQRNRCEDGLLCHDYGLLYV